MNVLTTKPLYGLDGVSPMKDEKEKPATLGPILVNALLAPEELKPEQKYERGKLAQRLFTDGEVKVSAEDVVLLKACVGRVYGPLVVLRVWEALEG